MLFKLKQLNYPLFDAKTEFDEENGEVTKEKGLSELVRSCFGKILDKSEQMSNWENRPLRKSQIIYAG